MSPLRTPRSHGGLKPATSSGVASYTAPNPGFALAARTSGSSSRRRTRSARSSVPSRLCPVGRWPAALGWSLPWSVAWFRLRGCPRVLAVQPRDGDRKRDRKQRRPEKDQKQLSLPGLAQRPHLGRYRAAQALRRLRNGGVGKHRPLVLASEHLRLLWWTP